MVPPRRRKVLLRKVLTFLSTTITKADKTQRDKCLSVMIWNVLDHCSHKPSHYGQQQGILDAVVQNIAGTRLLTPGLNN